MAIQHATQTVMMVKYTGANSAEVLSLYASMPTLGFGTWSVESEVDGVLTLRTLLSPGNYYTTGSVSAGNWAIIGPGASWSLDYTDAYMAATHMSFADMTASSEMATPMNTAISTALSGRRQYLATKAVTIPASGLSLSPGTRTVAVSWGRTLPAGAYDIEINPDSALQVGPYTYSTTSPTTTGCTLQYTNAALVVSLGAGTVDLTASKV